MNKSTILQNGHSTTSEDYQNLSQEVGAMSKSFPTGSEVNLHAHKRNQLLYAIKGTMCLYTENGAWIVPPDIAIYIPSQTKHSIKMRGDVEMRTLYIRSPIIQSRDRSICVIMVSDLLRELIKSLMNENKYYKPNSRGDFIAKLIRDEISLAKEVKFHINLPQDPRLRLVCFALLENPADNRTIGQWSETAGASQSTLARLFLKELGISFIRWRQRVRFINALESLSSGKPISHIARENGYNSPSAFSASFKQVMGMLPSKIIKNSHKNI